MNALGRLGRFVRRRPAEDRCGLCAAPLGEGHPHLVRVATGQTLCGCAGCASVLAHETGAFRRVPDRVLRLAEPFLSEEDWAAFAVPVGVAFFVKSSARGTVLAFYPSPIGAVESTVPPEAWDRLRRKHPALDSLEADVEALLVRKTEAFLVPVDVCYALIGVLKREWRGLTGGDGIARAVEDRFAALRARSEA